MAIGNTGPRERRLWAAALLLVVVGCQSRPESTTSDEVERRAAMRETLSQLEVRRAAPLEIFEAIKAEPVAALRAQAALAIARSEHLEMLGPLETLLQDPSPQVRVGAAFGLGQLDLALEPERKSHAPHRRRAETALARALETESDLQVRSAVMRALGRVADGPGLSLLMNLASVRAQDRATALTALGVAGARGRRRERSTALIRVVKQALSSTDAAEQRAAAYAAFRHRLPFDDDLAKRLAATGFSDAQARVHLLRAIPADLPVEVDVKTGLSRALKDRDWRVRVEGIRAVERLDHVYDGALGELIAAGQGAVDALTAPPAKGPKTTEGAVHVVTEACAALVNSPRDQTAPLMQRWQKALKPRAPWAACRCAVARDAQEGKVSSVEGCAPEGWDRVWTRRFAVMVAAQTELPLAQRVAWLATALRDASRLVRLDAAMALEAQGEAASDAALRFLADEKDPTVAAVLLRTAASAAKDPRVLLAAQNVVTRFYDVTTFEKAEPLIEAAHVLKTLRTPDAQAALGRLSTHRVAQVRLAAAAVPFSERGHGPLAMAAGAVDPADLPARAVISTTAGDIEIVFERGRAPLAVQNFVDLARKGAYDGTTFHRVIPNFVAQGGDPEGTGSGGPGYTIPCENHDGRYTAGAVGMALAGKDTGGSQFFITHSDQPHLDGRYTLFARVSLGLGAAVDLTPVSTIKQIQLIR